jgi:predicted secreted protein
MADMYMTQCLRDTMLSNAGIHLREWKFNDIEMDHENGSPGGHGWCIQAINNSRVDNRYDGR